MLGMHNLFFMLFVIFSIQCSIFNFQFSIFAKNSMVSALVFHSIILPPVGAFRSSYSSLFIFFQSEISSLFFSLAE